MKRTVTIFSPDKEIAQLLRLELTQADIPVELYRELPKKLPPPPCCFDLDAFPDISTRDGDVVFSRHPADMLAKHPCVLLLPFSIGSAVALFEEKTATQDTLQLTPHDVRLHGKTIELTQTEHAMLALLVSAAGETVSREALADTMRDGAKDGAVNVYIHYLRKKLELDGSRIILSTRGGGYRIDKRFLPSDTAI